MGLAISQNCLRSICMKTVLKVQRSSTCLSWQQKKKKTPEEVNNFLVMKVFITLSPDYAADSYLVSGLIFHPESLKLFLALKVKQ